MVNRLGGVCSCRNTTLWQYASIASGFVIECSWIVFANLRSRSGWNKLRKCWEGKARFRVREAVKQRSHKEVGVDGLEKTHTVSSYITDFRHMVLAELVLNTERELFRIRRV